MLVYRYMCPDEFLKFQTSQSEFIGRFYYGLNLSNTHHYKKHIRYMHFFKKLKDLKYIQNIKKDEEEYYLCLFNIPISLLFNHSGFGYYNCSGYDVNYMSIREYAIPSKKIKPEYLISVIKDNNKTLTAEQAKEIFNLEIKQKS